MSTLLTHIRTYIHLYTLMSISVFVCLFAAVTLSTDEAPGIARNKESEVIHYSTFSQKDVYGIQGNGKGGEGSQVFGGIVSHHLYLAPEMAKFYARMKIQKPSVVVVVGPNHYSLGGGNILVSKATYDTPWGTLPPALRVIDSLLESGVVRHEERPFETEHSIGAEVAYIREAFPDTTLVPIIIKRETKRADLDALVGLLVRELPPDALVIASVDFSHHGTEVTSQFHDMKSISAIQNFDYDALFSLEVDSPPSLYTLLSYLDNKGAHHMSAYHTNSAIFGANMTSDDVTSYLFAYFTQDESMVRPSDTVVTILNFGDMMFDRGVRSHISKGFAPFEFIRGVEGNFLRGVDIIVGNLEGPIIETDRLNCQSKELTFQFASNTAQLLREANFTLVNMANNHSFDCLEVGRKSTKSYLSNAAVGYFGGNTVPDSHVIKKVSGKDIAYVGIDDATHPVPLDELYALVARLASTTDKVVVNIHFGYEYDTLQSHAQEEIARSLIDNGADVVFGHHPHVVQPLEIYKGKAIFYSLGNLVFDQLTKETNTGIGVGVAFASSSTSYFIFPYVIDKTQPKFMGYNDMKTYCDTFLKDQKSDGVCRFTLPN